MVALRSARVATIASTLVFILISLIVYVSVTSPSHSNLVSGISDPTQFNREDEFHSSSAVIPSQYNRDSELHSSSPVISSQYNEDSELHSSSPVISSQYNNELHSSSPDPTKLNGNELHNVFQLDPPQFNGDLHNIVNVDQKPFQIDNDLHNISRVEKDRQPPSKDLHNSLNGPTSGVPSVSTLLNKMRECSLAMGISKERFTSHEAAIHGLTEDFSLYMNGLSSVIPQQFSSSYRSHCWKSPFNFSSQAFDMLVKRSTISNYCHLGMNLNSLPATHGGKESLLCLPAFFLAGFPKCGTTTLHTVLYQHNMILESIPKEPHWWTRIPMYGKSVECLQIATLHYLAIYYRHANSDINKNPQLLTYDASQSTLWDSHFHLDIEDYCTTPIALSHFLPSAKFIVVMRNPVARTYSHFLFGCTDMNKEPPSSSVFHEKVVKHVNFFKECLSKNHSIYECAHDKKLVKPYCGIVAYRMTVSMYYLHIKKWLQFYPRESFLFLRTEDMSDAVMFMRKITDFLNIDPLPHNTAKKLTHKQRTQSLHTEILPETSAILSEFFRPYNEMLVELIGDKSFLWEDSL